MAELLVASVSNVTRLQPAIRAPLTASCSNRSPMTITGLPSEQGWVVTDYSTDAVREAIHRHGTPGIFNAREVSL